MEHSFSHVVKYADIGNATIEEIAAALVANDRITKRIPVLIEGIVPGLKIDAAILEFHKLERGSLIEDLVVKIYATHQTQIEGKVVEAVEALTGSKLPDGWEATISILVILVILFVARQIWKRLFPEKPSIHIEGEYNTYINIVGTKFSASREDIEEVLSRIFSKQDRRSLVKATTDFFRPAKRGGNSRISVKGTSGISNDAVSEFPSDADLDDLEDERIESHSNIDIEFHAWDRDRSRSGWAAHLPGIFETRTRASLAPTVSVDSVAGILNARADVFVIYKTREDGVEYPSIIHVLKIYPETKR